MRQDPIVLTEEQEEYLANVTPKTVPLNVTKTLLEYYLANKPQDSDWCVLPITNIEAYLGSSALSRMYMKELNRSFMVRKENVDSVSVYKTVL